MHVIIQVQLKRDVACDVLCDAGIQTRTRSAQNNGVQCAVEEETRTCNENACSICVKGENYQTDGRPCGMYLYMI